MLRVAPRGIDRLYTLLLTPSFLSQTSMFRGIDALLEAIEKICSMTGAYFLMKGRGSSLPIRIISIIYMMSMHASPNRKVANIPNIESIVLTPRSMTMDDIEQNTATGISLIIMAVIFMKSSLRASNICMSTSEYFPIIPTAMPQRTARKISCAMLFSRKGLTKFDGTISTIMSMAESSTSSPDGAAGPVAAAAAAAAPPAVPGRKR